MINLIIIFCMYLIYISAPSILYICLDDKERERCSENNTFFFRFRYKLVSIVNIGEKKDQGVRIGSRCVWDATRDNFAMVNFENPHLFATAAIYAVYYE